MHMIRNTVKMFVTLTVILVVTVHSAVADTGTALSPFQTVFDDIVHVVGAALAMLLMALLAAAANKLRQKYGIEVPAAWLSRINTAIDHGIAYAEEQGRKAVDSSPIESNEKLNLALQFVLQIVGDDKQLVALGEEQIKKLIESRLNQTRAPVLIATPTDGTSATTITTV